MDGIVITLGYSIYSYIIYFILFFKNCYTVFCPHQRYELMSCLCHLCLLYRKAVVRRCNHGCREFHHVEISVSMMQLSLKAISSLLLALCQLMLALRCTLKLFSRSGFRGPFAVIMWSRLNSWSLGGGSAQMGCWLSIKTHCNEVLRKKCINMM